MKGFCNIPEEDREEVLQKMFAMQPRKIFRHKKIKKITLLVTEGTYRMIKHFADLEKKSTSEIVRQAIFDKYASLIPLNKK